MKFQFVLCYCIIQFPVYARLENLWSTDAITWSFAQHKASIQRSPQCRSSRQRHLRKLAEPQATFHQSNRFNSYFSKPSLVLQPQSDPHQPQLNG
ncbi:hypothetical protein V8C40DRAFT_233937 [Trichoderma camerunense]